jgi:hypothetical protein
MNNHSPQIVIPKKFNLSPFGEGIVTEVLHEGTIFNLYRANIDGRKVVLKTPSPGLTAESLFTRSYSALWSHRFVLTSQGLEWLNERSSMFDPIKVATWILLAEAQTINLTAGGWNHDTIAIGTWDGLSRCWSTRTDCLDEPLDLRFLPVLVLPCYDAVTFSNLSHPLKRLLFPRMLPALWDALCKMPHGDLSESNLLINQTQNIFHLIDPGAFLSSSSDRHLSYEKDIFIFVTTPANYPIVPPFNHQPHDTTGLVSFIEKHIMHNPNVGGTPFFSTDNRSKPSASDLLAMGIIYYRILTGKEMFLYEDILPEKPAWKNSYRTPDFYVDGFVYEQLIESLSGNYIGKKLEKANLTQAEKRLAYALLNLEVIDKDHLLELSAAV